MAAPRTTRKGWLRVEGTQGAVANFHASKRGVKRGIQRATERNGRALWALTHDLAPKDTWFMAEHLRLEFTPQMLGFEVFFDPADFLGAGEPYYPPYVEYGTSLNPAQPFMGPAADEIMPQYIADVGTEVRKGFARARAS